MNFLIVASEKASLSDFVAGLEKNSGIELIWADSGEMALTKISEVPVDLVVADETLCDMTGLSFAAKLVSVNPMVNCAVISPLSTNEFHETIEGLGLVQLPENPGEKQAAELIEHIEAINRMMAGPYK